MSDITKYWYSRSILQECAERLHHYMDRRESLALVAPELALASDDKTLEPALLAELQHFQKQLGVGMLAENRGDIKGAIAALSDEEVLALYRGLGRLEMKLTFS